MASRQESEPGRFFRWVVGSIRERTLVPVRRALVRRRSVQAIAAACLAVGVVVVSHAINERFRGANGDAPVAIAAFIVAYLLVGWLIDHTSKKRLFPRLKGRIPWLAGQWLRIREKHPARAESIATVIFTVLLGGVLRAINVRIPSEGGDVILAAAALVVSYLFVSQVTNLMVGTLVRKVYSIGAAAQGDARATILAFVDRHLARLDIEITDILSEAGAALDVEDVQFWTEQCFAFGRGRYDGTDSHLPSDFVRLYPNYLAAHGAMLDDFPQSDDKQNCRILVGPHGAFRDDFIDRYEEGYEEFLEWHDGKKVRLLHLEREQADRLREHVSDDKHPLPTADIAVWYAQYALLFHEEPDSAGAKVRLWMVFPGHPWYSQCERLIDEMLHGEVRENERQQSTALPLGEAVPEIFQRELCRQWERFVDPEKRMEKLGPFFEKVLNRDRNGAILDAAAGIGSDALWLADHGFNVTLNEIEPVYRDIIEARFAGRDLRLYGADWRELYGPVGRWFTAVTVLGNSICLLMAPDQQTRALRQFYEVLYPGGHLIIDERNFEHFTAPNVAARIEQNPIRNFPYRGSIMYCGEEVKGCPKSISANDVVFRYYIDDDKFHKRMMAAQELNPSLRRELDDREIGALHLYPFSQGELGSLLEEVGFVDVTVYRDLEWSDPHEFDENGKWFDEGADFFTYVARKPHEEKPPQTQNRHQ
jgi:glycine/sarcosine N-methyltransferase